MLRRKPRSAVLVAGLGTLLALALACLSTEPADAVHPSPAPTLSTAQSGEPPAAGTLKPGDDVESAERAPPDLDVVASGAGVASVPAASDTAEGVGEGELASGAHGAQTDASDEAAEAAAEADALDTQDMPAEDESHASDSRGRSYEIITILPKDSILAIFEPTFISADEADARATDLAAALRRYEAESSTADQDAVRIVESALVIGVSINGDHRAYSVPFLSRHEIVNDVVGGMPVAVTW